MLPWSLEHHVFAYDTYVKNGESMTEPSIITCLCWETPHTWRIEDCNM